MSLLEESKAYKPFHYPWAVDYAVRSEQVHWHEGEASLGDDVNEWKSGALGKVEKQHITHILRLFTESDVSVANNYIDQFLPRFKNNEIRQMLLSFAAREGVHQRAYALLVETLGFPDDEFRVFLEYEQMSNKIEFMKDSDVNTLSGLGHALAKTVINEGVSLFGAFSMLLHYSTRGIMKGMGDINKWSLNDELLHCEGMVKLFRVFCEEHPRIVNDEFKKGIYEMFRQAVALEDKFLDLAYDLGEPPGLPKSDVKKYIRYLADRRLIQLGLRSNWHVRENPLPFMEWMSTGDRQANFFERKVVDYNKAGFSGEDWGYPEVA